MSSDQKYLIREELKLRLSINGKKIPLIPFVHNAFKDVIISFCKNLKGFEEGKIEIVIDDQ